MKNYSALVDISWLCPTFAPRSVNQLRFLREFGHGFDSTISSEDDSMTLPLTVVQRCKLLRESNIGAADLSKIVRCGKWCRKGPDPPTKTSCSFRLG